MRNEPNFSKSQMFITLIKTTNYNKKWTMDTWSKRTQTKPILSASGVVESSIKLYPPPSESIHPPIHSPNPLEYIIFLLQIAQDSPQIERKYRIFSRFFALFTAPTIIIIATIVKVNAF
jgi:hypothetical protein